MRAAILALSSVLLLAACDRGDSKNDGFVRIEPGAEPEAKPFEQPAPVQNAPTVGGPSVWTLEQSDEAAALVAYSAGQEALRVACAGGQLIVHASGITPVASEERLSIGAGDTVVALVAVPEGSSVQASGELDPALLTAIEAGQPIAANYGAQNAGPFAPPSAEDAKAFAAACRG